MVLSRKVFGVWGARASTFQYHFFEHGFLERSSERYGRVLSGGGGWGSRVCKFGVRRFSRGLGVWSVSYMHGFGANPRLGCEFFCLGFGASHGFAGPGMVNMKLGKP